jgi:hypothetical protein
MSTLSAQPPDMVPILSRGKHRNPRKGACFMEMASFLAGQRWSDHPACTHPLLAAVARLVNDHTSDVGRQRLAPLIPLVIGLTGRDLHVDARIALACATTALPVVSAEQQKVLAVSALACDRVLADLDGRSPAELEEPTRAALARVPHATRWAMNFTRGLTPAPKTFRRHGAPQIVRSAVAGIATGRVPDPDEMLYALLVQSVQECAAWTKRAQGPVPPQAPGSAATRAATGTPSVLTKGSVLEHR